MASQRVDSLLDTDLYKFTMQQAVLQSFPDAVAAYHFTNRGGNRFSRACFVAIQAAISHLSTLALTSSELAWLEKSCPFFTPSYLSYLSKFRFRPAEQVTLELVDVEKDAEGVEVGKLKLEIKGSWAETILYEVPIMAIISERYFEHVVTKWDYRGQLALAETKGKALFSAGCVVSEFGTRRRRSYLSQDIAIRGLIAANQSGEGAGWGKLSGTSNVHFAHKYSLAPIGTIAHEWVMGIAAIEGYEGSNGQAMDLWDLTYSSGALHIALTDTFSTKPFFDDFVSDPVRAAKWKGLRQDSGDPFKFIGVAKEAFERVGADPKDRIIVFSDGLDVPRCLELQKAASAAGIGASFGVGTCFTNDFVAVANPVLQSPSEAGEGEITRGEKSKALNMVIKLYQINDMYCVKISDELGKNTGDAEAILLVKQRFGLEPQP